MKPLMRKSMKKKKSTIKKALPWLAAAGLGYGGYKYGKSKATGLDDESVAALKHSANTSYEIARAIKSKSNFTDDERRDIISALVNSGQINADLLNKYVKDK